MRQGRAFAIAIAIIGVIRIIGVIGGTGTAFAEPPRIAAIAPADDARQAKIIGAGGEVYEPDGKGAWIHKQPISTAEVLVAAGRAGAAVVALGDGVVYRLAANGWSAIRLVQHGKAIMNAGSRSLAAVGKQLFALDRTPGGEATKVIEAPTPILAIGASPRGVVVAIENGLFKLEGAKLIELKGAPTNVRLVSDRWCLVDHGAVDLASNKTTSIPSDLTISVAAVAADGALVAIGVTKAGLELLTLRAGKLERDPLGVSGDAVGVVVDRVGRAVVALVDGRIAIRDKTWTIATVSDAPATEHTGSPPAISE